MVYNTGDLGRWLESGEIEIMGRKDDQVKVNVRIGFLLFYHNDYKLIVSGVPG
jgi:acyl-coenzyme A synthetase/AMP-(fatty) acid ligase